MKRQLAHDLIEAACKVPYTKKNKTQPVRRLPPMSDEMWDKYIQISLGKKEPQIGPFINNQNQPPHERI